jgi:hypothetical protein
VLENLAQAASGGEAEGTELAFGQLVKDEPRFEICRMFLACLQLANNGNVDITAKPAGRCVANTAQCVVSHRIAALTVCVADCPGTETASVSSCWLLR